MILELAIVPLLKDGVVHGRLVYDTKQDKLIHRSPWMEVTIRVIQAHMPVLKDGFRRSMNLIEDLFEDKITMEWKDEPVPFALDAKLIEGAHIPKDVVQGSDSRGMKMDSVCHPDGSVTFKNKDGTTTTHTKEELEQCSKRMRALWFKKNAAYSMMVRYPPGQTDERGNEEIAKEIANHHETNSKLVLGNTINDNATYEWEIVPGVDIAGFKEYPKGATSEEIHGKGGLKDMQKMWFKKQAEQKAKDANPDEPFIVGGD